MGTLQTPKILSLCRSHALSILTVSICTVVLYPFFLKVLASGLDLDSFHSQALAKAWHKFLKETVMLIIKILETTDKIIRDTERL